MAKKPAVKIISTGDSPKPKKIGGNGGIELRMPFPLTLHPNGPVTIKLGIKFDVPVIVGSTKVKLEKTVYLPGEEIDIHGTASVSEPTPLGTGDRVAVAVPLFPDFDLE